MNSPKTMENMSSTRATALSNVAPAGEAALQPCPWAGCSWEALLRGVSVQEGSPALHLEAKRGHNPVVQSCSPSHQK